MEIFILIFGAVFLFFYFLKKESEKSDKRYLDQIRFFNDSHIQNQSQKILNDLYRDVQDVFSKNNSQRQFYTVPGNRIPHDQSSFAHWLYGTPQTCKEGNGVACLSQRGRGSGNAASGG